MSISLKANLDGINAEIQIGGVKKVDIGANGIPLTSLDQSSTNTLSVAAATAADHAVRADQLKSGLTSITAAIAAPTTGKITFTLAPCVLDFRNSAVANGTPSTRFISSTLTLATDNNGASFGASTAVRAHLRLLAIDTGSGIVLGVTLKGQGYNLDEAIPLTSTTAITGAVTSETTVYTTSALGAGNYPFRVVGAVDATWTTGSGWITTLAAVVNAGGNTLTAIPPIASVPNYSLITGSNTVDTYTDAGVSITLPVGLWNIFYSSAIAGSMTGTGVVYYCLALRNTTTQNTSIIANSRATGSSANATNLSGSAGTASGMMLNVLSANDTFYVGVGSTVISGSPTITQVYADGRCGGINLYAVKVG